MKLFCKKNILPLLIILFAILNAYLIYAIIANIVVWNLQPRFITPSGETTASMGFFVQFVIYCAFFLLAAPALVVLSVMYKKRRSKALKADSVIKKPDLATPVLQESELETPVLQECENNKSPVDSTED